MPRNVVAAVADDGSSPFALRPLEWIVLRTVRRLCQRAVVGLALLALLAGAVAVLVRWMAATGDAGRARETTLYNPDRLNETLRRFALPGGGGGASSSAASPEQRHRTEAVCRAMLETMLGFPLPKVRPKWLVNPTTRRCLELDMYSAEHKLAFEYDGAQHDVYTPHFHANPHHFEYRQLLDRLKTELCREAGVLLIRIPWSAVSASDEARTARFLTQLLDGHRLPFRPLLPSTSVDSRQSMPIAEISGPAGMATLPRPSRTHTQATTPTQADAPPPPSKRRNPPPPRHPGTPSQHHHPRVL